jgi:hypothetical protein
VASGRRDAAPLRWLASLGLALAALGAQRPAAAQTRPAPEPIDAELLRDLDLLSSGDYQRDREVARRLRFLERMRMIERMKALEEQPPAEATGTPARAPQKEVR